MAWLAGSPVSSSFSGRFFAASLLVSSSIVHSFAHPLQFVQTLHFAFLQLHLVLARLVLPELHLVLRLDELLLVLNTLALADGQLLAQPVDLVHQHRLLVLLLQHVLYRVLMMLLVGRRHARVRGEVVQR